MISMPLLRHHSRFPVFAALVFILCGGAMAFSALQFDTGVSRSVSVTGGCVVAWVSTRGGVIASPCHANGVGWSLPKYGSKGVVGFSSASGTASPISFPLTETGLVARAFIVADGSEAAFVADNFAEFWNQCDPMMADTASANWNAPERFPTNSYMHPKAVFELRSNPISGGHGHQATYDMQGNIITTSIKAGTADFASPSKKYMLLRLDDHRVTDVKPYIQALQLDGNPVLPSDSSGNISTFWTRNLTRPPLRVGPFTQQYLQRRPTTPTGVLNIP